MDLNPEILSLLTFQDLLTFQRQEKKIYWWSYKPIHACDFSMLVEFYYNDYFVLSKQAKDVLICYGVSLLSCWLIVVSLVSIFFYFCILIDCCCWLCSLVAILDTKIVNLASLTNSSFLGGQQPCLTVYFQGPPLLPKFLLSVL